MSSASQSWLSKHIDCILRDAKPCYDSFAWFLLAMVFVMLVILLTRPRRQIEWVLDGAKRCYEAWVGRLSVGVSVVLVVLVLAFVAVFCNQTEHLRVEARTGFVEIEFSPGQPIAWALGGARLLDCSQLIQASSSSRVRKRMEQPTLIAEEGEIELAAIREDGGKRFSTVRARVSLDRDDLVIELEPQVRPEGGAGATAPDCSKDANPSAVLDAGDGLRHAIRLPAQLRLGRERLGNGLTLEFRGGLRVGNDVNSSRQPLLTSGRFALWEVREVRPYWPGAVSWLWKGLAVDHFEIEGGDLGLGDKVTIPAPSFSESTEGAPRGFVRIVKGERYAEMSVYATGAAAQARIVRPFNPPEPPKAHLLRRLWADELLSKLAALIAAVFVLGRQCVSAYYGRSRPGAHAVGATNDKAEDA